MEFWLTNPLEDVYRTSKKPYLGYYNRKAEPCIEMARNSRESIQLAINAGETAMRNITLELVLQNCDTDPGISFDIGGVRLIHNSSNSINIGSKIIRATLPGELPQSIEPVPKNIGYRQTGSFFITANTTADTVPGKYEYLIRVHYGTGKNCHMKCEDAGSFTVEVFSATLPDASKSDYTHLTWINFAGYTPECDYKRMYETNATTYGIEMFSEEWFTLLKNYAVQMKKDRINVVTVPLYPLLNRDISFGENGEYIFDFTLLDRFLDTFLEFGEVKYFCGFHLMNKGSIMLGHEPEDNPEFPLTAYVFKEGHGIENFAWMYMNDERVWRHLEMFIKGLYNHLSERGLTKMWLQHVCDEVKGEEAFNAVLKTYNLVHEWAPDFKTIDATWEDSFEKYGEALNIHVPQIDIHDLNAEKYDKAIDTMDIDVWSYTCLKPQFNYLSRLDDFKLIATRLIHWYNFKKRLSGYLHWSWNLWHYGKPFEDGCCAGWPLDGWVMFPDVENLDVFESVRQRENVSGIEDLELLRLCDKIDHEKTMMLVSVIIERANDFTVDTDLFFRVRRMLLELASGK